jgi:hypothetical protein
MQETYGVSVAEAMASGLPVVASDWDGYRELITHGDTGFLVPSYVPRFDNEFDVVDDVSSLGNPDNIARSTAIDVHQLMACLRMTLESPERCREMGNRARAFACSHLDWAVILRQYEDLWDSLIEQGGHVKQQPMREISHINSYPFPRIFSHYPTAFVQPSDRFHSGPLAEWLLREHKDIKEVLRIGDWFTNEMFAQVFESLRLQPETSLEQLESELSALGTHSSIARAYIGRLLKYGLLERC